MKTENEQLQEIKDAVAQAQGYHDWEELISIEDGPANPEDVDNATIEIAKQWASLVLENQWTLSREKMPDFDGYYYVFGFMHHSCGNVTPFHKIVECKNNQWVKGDVGEQMTYWRPLLNPPKIVSIEDQLP